MFKRSLLVCMVIAMTISLLACGGESESSAVNEPTDKAVTAGATEYPLTVTDASGVKMTFDAAPKRIVSITPSETEIVYAVGAGDLVAGVDDWSDYPAEAASKPKVGGIEMSLEKIIALEPDLVVAGWTMSMAMIKQLRELGVMVYASENKSIDDTIAHIRGIGVVLNRQTEAETVVAKMEADRQRVAEITAGITESEKKRVYLEFSLGWTVGKGEFMDQLITEAGGVNVADQPGWYEISSEKIIVSNPNVILFGTGVESLEQVIRGRSGWDQIDAIKQGLVIGIDDNLLSRPGPRLTDGLVVVSKALYPEQW
jgi:iron complex transport system substrate-binding protein